VVAQGPVTFRINSIPIGATVRLAGKVMGLTPIAFEVPADENGEATAELTLELRGYQALTFIATSSGPRFDLVQRLRKGTGRVTLAPVRPGPVTTAPLEAPVVNEAPVEAPEVTRPVESPMPVAVAPVELAPAPAPVVVAAGPTSGVVPLEQVSSRPKMISVGKPPLYTREAMTARVEGTSVARCRVTVTGSLTNCHITKSVPMLDEAVIASLGTRQYEPAKVGANAVETEISIVTRLSAH
jgi:TonB family protein